MCLTDGSFFFVVFMACLVTWFLTYAWVEKKDTWKEDDDNKW